VKGRGWWFIAAIVAAVVFLPGGAFVAVAVYRNRKEEMAAVRRALREAAVKHDVDPVILEAIGWVESNWKVDARSTSAADEARGGAYGPTQITEKTARGIGYTGPMDALRRDVQLAADLSAKLMRARPGGPPTTVQDAGAWWNAGRTSAAQLGPEHVTRRDYIPKAVAAYQKVLAEPLA
jgi:soluble lytic murein transglycosylase-like protein